jgi:hypothetical protein
MIPQNNHTKHRPILLTLSIPIINNVYYGALTIDDYGVLERVMSIENISDGYTLRTIAYI